MEMDYNVSEMSINYKTKVKATDRTKIVTSKDAYELLKSTYQDGTIEHKEFFKILLLDNSHKVLGYNVVSEGGISETCVDVRIILQMAILCNASCIILAHNHPSGNLKPSQLDKSLTDSIIKAAKLLRIQVSDHIILSEDGYYSFGDEGEI